MQGWRVADYPGLQITIAPNAHQIANIINSSPLDTIHVLAGARMCTMGKAVTKEVIRRGSRLGIVSESADRRGWKILPRWLKYATENFTYGRYFNFILAMGQLGVDWFRYCGYESERIFEFGYVVDASSTTLLSPITEARSAKPFTILFAGRLIQLKGVNKLLSALGCVTEEFRLEIIGDGDLRDTLQEQSEQFNLSKKIIWHGQKPRDVVLEMLHRVDLLVLPSYKDGWGAVVNEALMAGTPVICSRESGASSLISQPFLGDIYPAKDSQALSDLLRQRIAAGPLVTDQRKAIRDWAQCISPTAMAEYFEKVMLHVYEGSPRPEVPWKCF